MVADITIHAEQILEFGYTNYRGVYGLRHAMPIKLEFGSDQYHPDPQWLMTAIDVDKSAYRRFAVNDMMMAKAIRDRNRFDAQLALAAEFEGLPAAALPALKQCDFWKMRALQAEAQLRAAGLPVTSVEV